MILAGERGLALKNCLTCSESCPPLVAMVNLKKRCGTFGYINGRGKGRRGGVLASLNLAYSQIKIIPLTQFLYAALHHYIITFDLPGTTLQREAETDIRTSTEYPSFSTSKMLGLPQSFG